MAKWIKNNSGTQSTYGGQDITNGAYYQIQSHQEISWANNSALLTDIASGDAIVAKDDSGNNDIADVNAAINYLKDIETTPLDTDGVPLSRAKITKSGWHFQLHGVEFCTSGLASSFNEDADGNDLGFTSLKFYDGTDTELVAGTQAELDTDCVKTVLDFEVDQDIEVIGGLVEQATTPTTNVRLWVLAIPDLTVAQGGSVPFTQGGVNLRYISGNLDLDGKTPKLLPYNATYHTNKFQITVKHTAGENHILHILFEYFRENV